MTPRSSKFLERLLWNIDVLSFVAMEQRCLLDLHENEWHNIPRVVTGGHQCTLRLHVASEGYLVVPC